MTLPSPAVRKARARLGALTRIARGDAEKMAATARAGFQASILREVDPDGTLSPQERAQRYDAAMKARMTRVSLARLKKQSRKQRRPQDGT